MSKFELVSDMEPKGDQPYAIEKLTGSVKSGAKFNTLLGVTGSGKTFVMANLIKNVNKPTLVISHNKTLAAQLYSELRSFFPDNAVHYFVSYYDYYQPEAYIPQRDIYIEKDASINEDLDRLRLSATASLLSRRDVIIVASVSCIYNIGSPIDYYSISTRIKRGVRVSRDALLRQLVEMQYERNEFEFVRGKIRVRGDIIDVFPSYENKEAVRIELSDDQIDKIKIIDPMTNTVKTLIDEIRIFPAKYFITPQERIDAVLPQIEEEMIQQVQFFQKENKLVEAQRIEARTRYDMEMLHEVGFCKGIENYSRYLSGRSAGERPFVLIDYFPKDFLCIADESHVTLPQIRGMYNGDRSRKTTLIEYGFRLPSALDNRPLKFQEWESLMNQIVFVSATPGEEELKYSTGNIAELVIRPTGLVDPQLIVKPVENQIQDLIKEIEEKVAKNQRILVTTLTKRLAEDLSAFLLEKGIKAKYLHSEIQTIDRVKILKDLRSGKFSVLVGVNLLREGLDLPEVGLVAILDADKEGFLRSETSLVQTVGRAARNIEGKVILYADRITNSMQRAMSETERRRQKQVEYNQKHGITPQSIQKEIKGGIEEIIKADDIARESAGLSINEYKRAEIIKELEEQMLEYASKLKFEEAIVLREKISELKS
ncbi:MAG: excinuclease ABC subunit UvrB [Planctomycetes bacterium]|nr:excinuclease ABC subunit UvrB [Planctomycetota bacterium]